jgi:hypothetical protein
MGKKEKENLNILSFLLIKEVLLEFFLIKLKFFLVRKSIRNEGVQTPELVRISDGVSVFIFQKV